MAGSPIKPTEMICALLCLTIYYVYSFFTLTFELLLDAKTVIYFCLFLLVLPKNKVKYVSLNLLGHQNSFTLRIK